MKRDGKEEEGRRGERTRKRKGQLIGKKGRGRRRRNKRGREKEEDIKGRRRG